MKRSTNSTPSSASNYAKELEVAKTAAKAGGRAALAYFEKHFARERKEDDSWVTAADKAAEAAILKIIEAAFPEHAILSEESGVRGGKAKQRWIIDPLDG